MSKKTQAPVDPAGDTQQESAEMADIMGHDATQASPQPTPAEATPAAAETQQPAVAEPEPEPEPAGDIDPYHLGETLKTIIDNYCVKFNKRKDWRRIDAFILHATRLIKLHWGR